MASHLGSLNAKQFTISFWDVDILELASVECGR